MPREVVTVKNMPEFRAAMQRLKTAPAGKLGAIAEAGLLPIQNAAIQNAPYKSGTLRRSIHTEIIENAAYRAKAVTGTDVAYARRLEYGFQDRDALGRRYNQPARPYMRPAYDSQRGAAISEVTAMLRELVSVS